MSVLGWCLAGQHEGKEGIVTCRGKFQKFARQTIRRKETIVMLDEWHECDCKCHKPAPVKTTRKKKS